MWWKTGVIIAVVQFFLVDASQNNAVGENQVTTANKVTEGLNPVTSTRTENLNKTEDSKKEEQTPRSEDSNKFSEHITIKVARHLAPKMLLKEKLLAGIKRPNWFSSKIGDRQMIIVKKVQGKPNEASVMPAQRSLDGGIGGLVNNFDLYGNQAVLPTSGTPNSLDHLYLPDMVTKEFAKPLELNGIGHTPADITGSATGEFSYGKQTNFRGNPIDINYHRSSDGGLSEKGRSGHHEYHRPLSGGISGGFRFPHPSSNHPFRDPSHRRHQHHEDGQRPPPRQHLSTESPEDVPNFPKHGKGKHPDASTGHHPDILPPGRNSVAGDAGFHNIIDLANLIHSGQFEQLTNLQSNPGFNMQGPAFHRDPEQDDNRRFNGPPKHLNDEFQDENYNQFDKDRDFVHGENGVGKRQYGFEGPENSGEGEYNDFSREPYGHGGTGGHGDFYSGSTHGGPDFDQERPNEPNFDRQRPDFDRNRQKKPSHFDREKPHFDQQRPNKHDYNNERPDDGNEKNNQFHSRPNGPNGWNENIPGLGGENQKNSLDRPRGEPQKDMSFLNGKNGQDSPPPADDGPYSPDSNFDYDDGGRREGGEHDGGDNPNEDNHDRYTGSHQNVKGQHEQIHQRPVGSHAGFEDDYNNSQEQFDLQQNQNINHKNVHRTPNGFGELLGFDT